MASLDLPLPTAADHADVFVLDLAPYASVYTGPEGMIGGEARDRVAGFFRAMGTVPPAEPDHVSTLLGAYASLCDAEAAGNERATVARGALLWEHILSWMPFYLLKVVGTAPASYRAWGRLLLEALLHEARRGGHPESLPLHLRSLPALTELPNDASSAIGVVLAPARSGVLITRTDLVTGARRLGLGVRMGERAYMLRSMLEQDPAATLGWLSELAAAAETSYEALDDLGDVALDWTDRAGAIRALLDNERDAAREVMSGAR
jgi:hypothetical protein